MSKLKRHLPILFLIILGSLGHSPLYGQLNKAYYYYKSEELISQGRYSESLPVLNTLIGIDSSLFEGWFLRGVAKYNLGDIRGAISLDLTPPIFSSHSVCSNSKPRTTLRQ